MSIKIKIPRSSVVKLRRVVSFQLSLKWVLVISFILSFTVRLIPELYFPVPVGFDTALYVTGAKYNSVPRLEFRMLQKFILPYVYHVLKIDLLTFMRIYAPLIHGLTTAVLVLYAAKVLSWDRIRLLVLTLLLSLTPGILRMAWDTHSQNLGTLMLAGMLVVMGRDLKPLRLLVILPLMALIALTHQLVAVIALAILFVEALASIRRPKKLVLMALAFVACVLITTQLNPVLTLSGASKRIGAMLTAPEKGSITPFTLAIQGLVVVWYIAPVAIIGLFGERRLLTWAIVSVAGFLLGFLVANPGLLVPGRWITYSSIPLAFFSANSISVSRRGIPWKKIASITFIVLTLSTGVGMLLPSGTPITSLMHKAYDEMPEMLASSTARREHIEAIMELTGYLNSMKERSCLITHYPWFFWWSWYFYEGKTLYNGPSRTTEESLRTFIETRATKCDKVYIIWFTGLTWAKELKRKGELALYEYRFTKS